MYKLDVKLETAHAYEFIKYKLTIVKNFSVLSGINCGSLFPVPVVSVLYFSQDVFLKCIDLK